MSSSAGVLAGAIYAFAAWEVSPSVPGGDEPHYLIITQSLLIDHALTIDDVHRRGDYRAYYPTELQPHVQTRGKNGRIYSVHAPGLPALVAPAFLVGGYRAVVGFLILIAACGAALAWHVGWLSTRRTDAAWFGWAAVTLPVTTIFQSFTIYPDGVGGVLTLTGMWALLRAHDESTNGETRLRPWVLHGAALALLPWLHSRFAVLAGGLGALVLLRLSSTKNPAAKAVGFLAIPTLSGSAAYAFAETFNWREGLDEKLRRARQFYSIVILSTVLGIVLDFLNVNAIRLLYLSAILNGLLAPFLLVAILFLASDPQTMHQQPSSRLARIVVGLTTILMFAAAVGMFVL